MIKQAACPHLVARLILAGLWVAGAGALHGCELFGAMGHAFQGGEKVNKLHQLADKKTLILVDTLEGPEVVNVLANPMLRNTVASDMAYYLEKEGALPGADFVSLRDLNRLIAEMGDDYAKTPIDEIARRLGAQQVIHILIESASLRISGTLYQPTASGQIKVIDVERGKRTFPRTMDLEADGDALPGRRFTVELEAFNNDMANRAVTDELARKLAKEIAVQLSQYFYDWKKPDLGSQIK